MEKKAQAEKEKNLAAARREQKGKDKEKAAERAALKGLTTFNLEEATARREKKKERRKELAAAKEGEEASLAARLEAREMMARDGITLILAAAARVDGEERDREGLAALLEAAEKVEEQEMKEKMEGLELGE